MSKSLNFKGLPVSEDICRFRRVFAGSGGYLPVLDGICFKDRRLYRLEKTHEHVLQKTSEGIVVGEG
jgi:hypothetical protein